MSAEEREISEIDALIELAFDPIIESAFDLLSDPLFETGQPVKDQHVSNSEIDALIESVFNPIIIESELYDSFDPDSIIEPTSRAEPDSIIETVNQEECNPVAVSAAAETAVEPPVESSAQSNPVAEPVWPAEPELTSRVVVSEAEPTLVGRVVLETEASLTTSVCVECTSLVEPILETEPATAVEPVLESETTLSVKSVLEAGPEATLAVEPVLTEPASIAEPVLKSEPNLAVEPDLEEAISTVEPVLAAEPAPVVSTVESVPAEPSSTVEPVLSAEPAPVVEPVLAEPVSTVEPVLESEPALDVEPVLEVELGPTLKSAEPEPAPIIELVVQAEVNSIVETVPPIEATPTVESARKEPEPISEPDSAIEPQLKRESLSIAEPVHDIEPDSTPEPTAPETTQPESITEPSTPQTEPANVNPTSTPDPTNRQPDPKVEPVVAQTESVSIIEPIVQTKSNPIIKPDSQPEPGVTSRAGDFRTVPASTTEPETAAGRYEQPQNVAGAVAVAAVAAGGDAADGERTDALTKKPLDLEQEEETRKLETCRWLESHFGSESSHTSAGSDCGVAAPDPAKMRSGGGGINVTMSSKSMESLLDQVDRAEHQHQHQRQRASPPLQAPPAPPPPPFDPLGHLRIYATPSRPVLSQHLTESRQSIDRILQDRVQVLPVGPERVFHNNKPSSPAPPIYKSTAAATPKVHNIKVENVDVEPMTPVHQSDPVRKAAAELLKAEPVVQEEDIYSLPIQRRWPPAKNESEPPPPVAPARATVIRLGGGTSAGVGRSQSMSSAKPSPRMAPSAQQQHPPHSLFSRSPVANEDLVPEREKSYYVDIKRSFGNSKVIAERPVAKSPPPPRPSQPPSIVRHDRSSSSLFSAGLNEAQQAPPPVRPVRRKSTRTKTDSGTQTIRKEMLQTQERPASSSTPSKPIKTYYLGQDPYGANDDAAAAAARVVTNGTTDAAARHSPSPTPVRIPRSAKVARSQTLRHDHDNQTSRHQQITNAPLRPAAPAVQQAAAEPKAVSRSRSFNIQNVASVLRRPISLLSRSSKPEPVPVVRAPAAAQPQPSKLSNKFQSTPYLNRESNFSSPLKSPGIVTSISKSQFDLHLNQAADAPAPAHTAPSPPPPPVVVVQVEPRAPARENSLHRKRGNVDSSTPVSRSQSSVQDRETYSSLHRRRMAHTERTDDHHHRAANATNTTYQASIKSSQRSFASQENLCGIKEDSDNNKEQSPPENQSLKDRIALLESAGIYANQQQQQQQQQQQTLPRIVSSKVKDLRQKQPEPAASKEDQQGSGKRTQFLKGLLNTAPELFMHIHGDENLTDVVDSPAPPAPATLSPVPPLTKPTTPLSPAAPYSFEKSNRSIYTSTPSLQQQRTPTTTRSPAPSSYIMRSRENLSSLNNSIHDLSVSRRSAAGSPALVPAVKIPAAVNYSETTRIKSSADDAQRKSQSDSVQKFTKVITPYSDGFCSQTQQSSENTTFTYTPYAIHQQESGGVIIRVRGTSGK